MDEAARQSTAAFMRLCDSVYQGLLQHVHEFEDHGDFESALKWVVLTAEIAVSAHPGRFADGNLEKLAFRLGQELDRHLPRDRRLSTSYTRRIRSSLPRRVLHVATTVFEVGGHTSLIRNWIKNDPDSIHSLLLIDQRQRAIPATLSVQIDQAGGQLFVLPEFLSILEKAAQLRAAAVSNADFVILHHHPNDAVPVVAFATNECPPVAIMNHADVVFGLGPSIADLIIDFRDFGASISSERRFARLNMLLPLPLDIELPNLRRSEARRLLDVPDDRVVLLSIGAAYKYSPSQTQDFFRTMNAVLARNAAAHLYMIGPGEADRSRLRVPVDDRIHLLGVVSNPGEYMRAADLYIEGFPYGSTTALMEMMALGVCPVLQCSPLPQCEHLRDEVLNDIVTNMATEGEYVEHVTTLIRDPATRRNIGCAVKQQVMATHSGEGWRKFLNPIYSRLESTLHQPALIPATDFIETDYDLHLSAFNHAHIQTAVLQSFGENTFSRLTFGDLLRLFRLSVRLGDTSLSAPHMRGWLGLLRDKVFHWHSKSDNSSFAVPPAHARQNVTSH